MKIAIFAFLALVSTLSAGDYVADYSALKTKVGKDKMDQYLADWRKREPDNPDAWIHSANWTLEMASAVQIQGKDGKLLPKGEYNVELRNGQMVIVGPDGKPAGQIGGSQPDVDGVRKAAAYLVEARKKWPQRVDIHSGLATIYAQGQLWKEHLETLRTLTVAARENAGKLRWCHDEKLGAPEEEFIAGQLHSFAIKQFRLENPQADERFREIAELTVQACPKSAKGYNDMAVYYGLSENWKGAQPVLEKASEVAPDDALVWMNLGDNCVRLGQPDAARKAYQKVLDLKPDAELKQAAEAALKKLGKTKK
jgi:tetratricopeptide (TPR) repeat protein